jgi:hypothetical protein
MERNAFLLIAGGLLCAALAASATTRYVNLNNPAPASPYTNWVTAATNIQHAVNVAAVGDDILVTNGVYQTGATVVYGMSNRVAVTKAVTVRSVNGPAATSIVGFGPNGSNAIRCVFLTNAALLAGFTLTNGATQTSDDWYTNQSGGGVWCESPSAVVSNCVLTGNLAYLWGGGAFGGTLNDSEFTGNVANSGGGSCSGTLNNCKLTGNLAYQSGGGAYDGTLNNCALTGNSAHFGAGVCEGTLNNCVLAGNSAGYYAGGATFGTLNNCTLVGNSASVHGGGIYSCRLTNCIAYYNMALSGGNYGDYSVLHYCCTTPLPIGTVNFTNPPRFVDTNEWSNLRLQAGSPCINAGTNAYAPGPTDLDGRARIVGGGVDLGAYEFQGAGMGEFFGWLQQYGLPTDGSADYADSDADGHHNWQEWIAGTNPTNAVSALRMLSATGAVSAVTVTWSSVTDRTYTLERATNLGAAPAFSVVQSKLTGLPGTTSFTDTNVLGSAPRFYRVRVEN